ncbi:hypothetical protein [Microbulbifer elongatus]|uniref:hypothetical protein n=1 Tax=Microbulbifer elongatus TaxID=86173 RepID=UPI001E2BC78B|nr:hypothetical protein [Microbulbifer elongatus]
MNKVFFQSRTQDAVSRIIQSSIYAIVLLVTCYSGSIFLDFPINEIYLKIYTFGFFVFQMAIFTWLVLFNTGGDKVVEHSLEITQDKVRYTDFGDVTDLDRSDIKSVNLKIFPSINFVILGLSGRKIEFPYFTFNSEQRRSIRQALVPRRC